MACLRWWSLVPELAALHRAFAGGDELLRAYVGDTLVAQMRTNLCTNPSFETNTTGWTAVTSALAHVNTEHHSGAYALRVTPSAATGGATFALTTVIGQDYTVSGWFFSATARDVELSADGETSGVQSLAAGVWERLSVTFTATGTTTVVSFLSVTTTDVFYLDSVLMEAGDLLGDEFDGSTLAAVGHGPASWTGTANASTSKMWGMPLT